MIQEELNEMRLRFLFIDGVIESDVQIFACRKTSFEKITDDPESGVGVQVPGCLECSDQGGMR